tara:strand:- start:44232 stop:44777 length:546 start_codon:yes stop_codon:yes gene_type:complete
MLQKKITFVFLKPYMKFKLLLILLLVGFSSFTVAHKFYLSVTEMEYSEKTQNLKITSHIFIDDLEDLLQTRYDKSIKLGQKNESSNVPTLIKKYLGKKLEINIDGKVYPVKYLGKIYEDDMALLFLEIEHVPSFKKIIVKNTILTDMYSEQKNLVHVAFKGTTKSLVLNKDKQEDVLNFNN